MNIPTKSKFQDLAIDAAINSEKNLARESWSKLVSQIKFDDFDDDISRLVPSIYSNLRGVPNLPETLRLKGVGRKIWSQNQIALNSVARALSPAAGLNYRILKGAALVLRNQNFSSRGMGDIDIAISVEELEQISSYLKSGGFHEEFSEFCEERRIKSQLREIQFRNKDNVQVDLHIAENHHLTKLLLSMLNSKPEVVDFSGMKLKIPTAEDQILHLIIHGIQNVARGDLLQAIVDFSQLSNLIDVDTLKEKILRDVHAIEIMEFVGIQKPNWVIALEVSKKRKRILMARKFLLSAKAKVFILNNALKARRIPMNAAWKASKRFGTKRIPYFIWLQFGKLRPLEEKFTKLFSGFTSVENASNVGESSFSQEIRFRVPQKMNYDKTLIEFRSSVLEKTSFSFFQDGKLVTVIGGEGRPIARYELSQLSKDTEFSLRLSAACCSVCALKFNDFAVEISYF